MLISNIKEFLKRTSKKKIICLDMGKKNVGIAMSNANKTISTPMKVLLRGKEFHCNLKKILVDYEVSGILIGIPLNDDNKSNKMCQSIIDTSKNLDLYLRENRIDQPIFFWDESYTSLQADEVTINLFKSKKKQKKKLDKYAASVILNDFLDYI
ncbi:MAG: Holliday junction resolvase RuvX [Rickettsiales bacterium]|nr:Holliday junction resolvase RuvX [Rickettsiales bacterium]|tara:strand:+ start:354 stop:815 length:462 start_codon:yes stop_codon:yes gene_type:complete